MSTVYLLYVKLIFTARSAWSVNEKHIWRTTLLHLQKPWTQRRSHGPTQKQHHVKANFIRINDIFFSQRTKNATYLIFPFMWRPVESKTEQKKAQHGTVSASQLVKTSQNAIFLSTQQISIVLVYCVQSLVGKGRFLATKRAQKRVCIVCLASAAILPFLMTSPDIQFWLSAALKNVKSGGFNRGGFWKVVIFDVDKVKAQLCMDAWKLHRNVCIGK